MTDVSQQQQRWLEYYSRSAQVNGDRNSRQPANPRPHTYKSETSLVDPEAERSLVRSCTQEWAQMLTIGGESSERERERLFQRTLERKAEEESQRRAVSSVVASTN